MSLMKTLAKVAIGVAVAKGASAMMKKSGSSTNAGSAGGLGGLLGGLTGGSSGGAGSSAGSLQDMLGGLMGGSAGSAGGLGGLLNQLGGGAGASGGLGGLLNQLGGAGGASASGGGLGGLLGGLAGAAGAGGLMAGLGGSTSGKPEREEADFGAVLNSQFDANPTPAIQPSQDQEVLAALMIAAMIQAAKSDGTFDQAEREKLLSHLGDVDAEEAAFVNARMDAPVDVDGLVAQTPEGMGAQVYAMSLLAIDLDTQDEAQYLHQLAKGYGMKPAAVNDIHEQMGVPSLYT
ncbi:tellurite resistance TerB family protein [uncultured Sulfitobacter sp.]|uniref:tellurite resistance TerB family protein n=1 Tax=uncultured Sulfitobacter sp. TaxID=191468 RepID=UPI0030FB852A